MFPFQLCAEQTASANKRKIRANQLLINSPLKMYMVSVSQWVQGTHSRYLRLWIEFGGRRTRGTPFLNLRPTLACLTRSWMDTDTTGRHSTYCMHSCIRANACSQSHSSRFFFCLSIWNLANTCLEVDMHWHLYSAVLALLPTQSTLDSKSHLFFTL